MQTNQEPTLSRICLALGALLILAARNGTAQTAPDFVFQVRGGAGCAGTDPGGNITNPEGWSCTITDSSVDYDNSVELSASASGKTLTFGLKGLIDLPDNSDSSAAGVRKDLSIAIYAKQPGIYRLSATNNAAIAISSRLKVFGDRGLISDYPFGRNLSAKVNGTGSASATDQTSPAPITAGSCAGGQAETFPQYGGTAYYRLRTFSGPGILLVASNRGSRLTGSLQSTITVDSAATGGGPVARIDGPYADGVPVTAPLVGATVTMRSLSWDPDDGTAPGSGICFLRWAVTRNGTTVRTGTGSNISFTGSTAGTYIVELGVTDNEGSTSTARVDVRFGKVPEAGTGISDACLQTLGCGQNSTAHTACSSGNAMAGRRDPVRTRGYPLATNIYVSSQSKFPALVTPVGLKASFSWGIAVRTASDGIRYLIGEDGSEFSYGPAAGPPSPAKGIFGTLARVSTGWRLSNAGPPGRINRSGNFQYDFSASGKLLKITDPAGNVQQVFYDAANAFPVRVRDVSTQKTIEFQYDTPGLIARIIENGGAAVSRLSYANKRLTGIVLVDALGTVIERTNYTYDAKGRLFTLTADDNPATTITWNYADSPDGVSGANMSWGSGASAGSTRFDYSLPPSPGYAFTVGQTNSVGGITKYDFNATGDLERVQLPLPNGAPGRPVFTFKYDSDRNPASVSDGATTVSMTWNAKGKLTELRNAAGVWTLKYMSNGIDLKTVSDTVGPLLAFDYTDPANPHSPTRMTDGGGNTWTTTYNAHGQVLSVSPPAGSPSGSTTFTYDEVPGSASFGYLRRITNGASDVSAIDSYSPLGDITSVTTSPRAGVTNTTRYEYDAAHRLKQLTHPDLKTVRFSYQGRDLRQVVDEKSTATTYEFCAVCGALEDLQAPLSKHLRWNYNGDHDLTKFVDARSKETDWTYGQARELEQVTYPDNQTHRFLYDASNRLRAFIEGRGRQVNYRYDAAGRVHVIDFASGPPQPDITYTYYPDGRLFQMTDEAGTTTYKYKLNRLVESVTYDYSVSGLAPLQTLKYSYNPDNSVASMTWVNGTAAVETWTYTYDGAGRMRTVSTASGDSATYAYDGEGKLTSQTNSNGTSVTYQYNESRGWWSAILHRQSGAILASYNMTYDDGANTAGNLTRVVESGGSQITYKYDPLYRLTSEVRTGSGAYSKTLNYDLAGNVTVKDGATFAIYDDANKIATLAGGSVSYDTAGNLLSVAGAGLFGGSFTWETRSKLRSQTRGSVSVSYEYDGVGRRVIRTPGGDQATFYIFAGGMLIGEVKGGAPAVAYTWGPDGLVSQRLISAGRTLFYHFGPQGETRFLTGKNGAIAGTYLYDAYGKTLSASGTDPNPYRYGGKYGYYSDGPLGLMLAGARWYSPHLMRWLSRDPIGYAGGDNLYAYVRGQPVQAVDPSGLTELLFDRTNQVLWVYPDKGSPYTIASYSGSGRPDGAQPIPLGSWVIHSSEMIDFSFLGDLAMQFKGDWGDWLVRIHRAEGNSNEPKRDRFFLHGGRKEGTGGCIDVQGWIFGDDVTDTLRDDILADPDGIVNLTVVTFLPSVRPARFWKPAPPFSPAPPFEPKPWRAPPVM